MMRNGVRNRIALLRCAIILLSAVVVHAMTAVALHAQETIAAPAARVPEDLPPLPMIGSGHLPRNLSPWSMFLTADIVVQAVIVGLVLASAITWAIWLAKSIELFTARRRLGITLADIRKERSLADAAAW